MSVENPVVFDQLALPDARGMSKKLIDSLGQSWQQNPTEYSLEICLDIFQRSIADVKIEDQEYTKFTSTRKLIKHLRDES